MKIAVISDIHANLEAFVKVLDDIDKHRADRIISLGDNIGYGPDPARVMELIQQRSIESVLGNHEMVLQDRRFLNWFNPKVRQNVEASHAMLPKEAVRAIGRFHRAIVVEGARFVHGCPEKSPFVYMFQLTTGRVIQKMNRMDEKICFVGHTHEPAITVYDPVADRLDQGLLCRGCTRLDPDFKYIVNAGSVGQPRDGSTDAKWLLFDTSDLTVDLFHVPYDSRPTIDKIRRAGFSESFAIKLMP